VTDNWKHWVSSSPDEQALVSFASEFGFQFVDRDFNDGSLNVTILKSLKNIKVHSVLEFSSDRKCMSVLIEYNGNFIL